MNKCELCGKEVDFVAGGCALMMAVCRKHNTNLINQSYCAECYDQFLADPLHELADKACLNLILEDGEETENAV